MSPFKSSAQQKFMFANKPAMAKEFASKTPNMKKLPKHVAKKKGKPSQKQVAKALKAKGMSNTRKGGY